MLAEGLRLLGIDFVTDPQPTPPGKRGKALAIDP